jgi:hypothetical protein
MAADFQKRARRILIARRALQMAVALGSLVPLLAGLAGIVLGLQMIDPNGIASVSLDSHFRYLSGLLLAIGLGFLASVPRIETHTARFQLLTAIVFIGGLSRLYALIHAGLPDFGMLFGLTMELVITPLLALAQYALARAYKTPQVIIRT